MKAKSILILYFIVLAVELFAKITFNYQIELFAKPLLMPILIAWYWANIQQKTKTEWFIFAALIFSCLGDIFLLPQLDVFIAGLGSFLVAHVLYIFAFKQKISFSNPIKLIGALPYLGLAVGMLVLLNPYLGELQIPVIIYTSIIALMGLFALNRLGFVNTPSFAYVLIGATSFMLSDSMIAINKFYYPFELSGFLIMLTYAVGQFLIVKGMLLSNPKS